MSNSLVSKLVFGTGGRFGRLSIYECQALVSFAYQNNIFSFDTGFSYSRGKSQSKLLQSLFSLEVRRSSFTFSTKIAIPTDSSSLYDRVSDLVLRNPSLNYVDTLFLWGPDSLSSLSEPVVSDLLRLKNDGLVKAIGVNTHNFALMNQLLVHSMHILDALMIDYNLLQLNRNDLVHYFHSHNTKHLWEGTALCQGFLVSDFFSLVLRSRSFSYLLRGFLNSPTRRYRQSAKLLRRYIFKNYPGNLSLPLSFVLQNSCISYVPLGMLSKSSITSNLQTALNRAPFHISRCCGFF